ncbi:MAG TPA: hypothetical protein VF228_17265 [Iamia sp.]
MTANKPKRGRQRTPDTIKARLAKLDDELAAADAITALNLEQERLDLEAELASKSAGVDLSGLESAFVANAKGYGDRKGISYGVWRKAGVAPAVLKKAGISRAS